MIRDGSGTAWLPDASPMYAFHWQRGDWQVMLHENVFLQVLDEAGDRGSNEARQHQLGHGDGAAVSRPPARDGSEECSAPNRGRSAAAAIPTCWRAANGAMERRFQIGSIPTI